MKETPLSATITVITSIEFIMFLSKETQALLKNFSNINSSILIQPGKKLRTVSAMTNIFAEAMITEEFEQEVGIYDLNQFLSCLSLVPGGELNLTKDSITISSGKNSIDYRCTDPSMIDAPPDKKIQLPSEDVKVTLTEDHLETVKKAAATLQIPDVSLVGDGETVYLTVRDKKNSGSNSYKIEIDKTDSIFEFNFKVENLKLLPGDYDVTIARAGIAKFESPARPLVYHIALEPDSTFNS